ncbi:MAG: ferredoxin [Marivita sp.]|uniref:ferredoxin n=1 Tax=Marivita sp. TaxID=2003365 RepID=UPI001B1AB2BC|nr:ferredoxin [Marivita sp.]MBO6884840.1 ferredoxin [Marivita sp.]
MTLDALESSARAVGLTLRGSFHPLPEDDVPTGTQTLVLLGPDEPAFWSVFTASSEYNDGLPHPLDRWSKRVTALIAADHEATVIFPYDGPPYAPFLRWAERSEASWQSPVGLLVHQSAGLFISYRAALALPMRLSLPARGQKPCLSCDTRPCETACPVGALAPGREYNVPACMAHIRSPDGVACREGCIVRRACPVSDQFGRLREQSAFHMRAFLGE